MIHPEYSPQFKADTLPTPPREQKEHKFDAYQPTQKYSEGQEDTLIDELIKDALREPEPTADTPIDENILHERLVFVKNMLSTNRLTETLIGPLSALDTDRKKEQDPSRAKDIETTYQEAKQETLAHIEKQLSQNVDRMLPRYQKYLDSLAELLKRDNYSEIIRLEKHLLERRKEGKSEPADVRFFLRDRSTDHVGILFVRLKKIYQQCQTGDISSSAYAKAKRHLEALIEEKIIQTQSPEDVAALKRLRDRVFEDNFFAPKEETQKNRQVA